MHPGSQSGLAPLGLKLDVSPALLRWMNEQLQRQEASRQLGGLLHLSTERFGRPSGQTPGTCVTACCWSRRVTKGHAFRHSGVERPEAGGSPSPRNRPM